MQQVDEGDVIASRSRIHALTSLADHQRIGRARATKEAIRHAKDVAEYHVSVGRLVDLSE